jgi:hypothetical protein
MKNKNNRYLFLKKKKNNNNNNNNSLTTFLARLEDLFFAAGEAEGARLGVAGFAFGDAFAAGLARLVERLRTEVTIFFLLLSVSRLMLVTESIDRCMYV